MLWRLPCHSSLVFLAGGFRYSISALGLFNCSFSHSWDRLLSPQLFSLKAFWPFAVEMFCLSTLEDASSLSDKYFCSWFSRVAFSTWSCNNAFSIWFQNVHNEKLLDEKIFSTTILLRCASYTRPQRRTFSNNDLKYFRGGHIWLLLLCGALWSSFDENFSGGKRLEHSVFYVSIQK